MMAQFKLSRYSHHFQKEGKDMLYHSLKMMSVCVDECDVDMENRLIALDSASGLCSELLKWAFVMSTSWIRSIL